VPENIIPAPLSVIPNSNYYGLQATIATWTNTDDVVSTIMDLGDVTVLTDKQCSRKINSLFKTKNQLHARFLCTFEKPPIVLEIVSNELTQIYE
jgi:hypothetical protein